MPLERELAAYTRALTDLLSRSAEGKYVVVHGDDIVGVYDTYTDALSTGYEKFELEPFMVKRVEQFEQALYFARDLGV